MRRTTLLADDDLLVEFKRMAKAAGRSTAQLMREALEEYIRARQPGAPRPLSFVGLGRSGRSDISERVDELLWQDHEALRPQR